MLQASLIRQKHCAIRPHLPAGLGFRQGHQYQTEVETWRHLQSRNYEFTMKRLREPVETDAAVDLDGIQR